MNLLSAKDAAEQLGITERQVRRLAAAGELPARRIADRWIIEADGVGERARAGRPAGRPLSASMAWSVLLAVDAALDDGRRSSRVPVADRRVRYRLRWLLAYAPPTEQWHHWLRHRGDASRVAMSPRARERLERDPRVHGVSGGGRWYVAAIDVDSVVARHRARRSEDGEVVLMVVPDPVAAAVLGEPGDLAPTAAALVDLLESDDSKQRKRAAAVLRAVCRKAVAAARAGGNAAVSAG